MTRGKGPMRELLLPGEKAWKWPSFDSNLNNLKLFFFPGFLSILGQLTNVGNVSKADFLSKLKKLLIKKLNLIFQGRPKGSRWSSCPARVQNL